MAAYLVGAIEIDDPAGYARYRDGVGAVLAGYDGVELLTADGQPDMLEGAQPAGHLFVVRFRSMQQIQDFYRSDAYREIIGHRHGSSQARFLMAMRGPD